jgi:hypothetical protein
MDMLPMDMLPTELMPFLQAPSFQMDVQEIPQTNSIIAKRLLYLLDLLEGTTLKMWLPAVKMIIASTEEKKLVSLLTSFIGTGQGVLNSDSSQDEFDDAVEPYIREFMAVVANAKD